MKPPPPGLRAFWLAAIAVQVSLPGAAAVADARLEQAAAAETTHIESQRAKACARVHPPDCGLCRFITTILDVPRPLTIRAQAGLRSIAPPATDSAPPRTRPTDHPPSRAPPLRS